MTAVNSNGDARRSFGLRAKISLPFALICLLVASVTVAIAVTVVSRGLERDLDERIDRAVELVARSDLAVNPRVVGMLERVVDAHIVTFAEDGTVLASTLGPQAGGLLDRIVAAGPTGAGEGAQTVRLVHEGTRFRVSYRRLATRPDLRVAFAVDLSSLTRTRRVLAYTLGGLALIVALVASLLARILARVITSPLERLVDHTRTLAAGRLEEPAPVSGSDEIGRLGAAFDEMARSLGEMEAKVIHGEKLALTGQMAARVAHDVRNPLASLKIQAQMLDQRGLPGENNRESVRAILMEIGRIERVVEGLLALSRPTQVRPEPGDPNELLEEVAALSAAQAGHQGIRVVRDLASELPPVGLDREVLLRALLDLVRNAMEAQPEGGELLVASMADEDGGSVELRLCDRGVGIDPEAGDRVFDPFFTTKREGVGLGLLNAREIVAGHGGALTLRPRSGGGTCAVVRLPVSTPGSLSVTAGDERGGSDG